MDEKNTYPILRTEISLFSNMDIEHNFENTIERDHNGDIADGTFSCYPTNSQMHPLPSYSREHMRPMVATR